MHDEDAVRGEEAVGLVGPAELARDDDADRSRRTPLTTSSEAAVSAPLAERAETVRASLYACSPTRKRTDHVERHPLDRRRARRPPQEFGDVYDGRTVLVTGADGFMGSHLTDALVELGATVHAFVRATSSGALNNIGHLRDRLKMHFADLTDRTSVDYLVRELKRHRARPAVRVPPRRPGARRRVVAPAVRDRRGERARHAEPAAVDRRLRSSSSRSSTPRARRRSTATSARPSPTTTTSTTRAGSSSTSARRSTRSRSTRPRRSRPTS